MTKRCKFCGTKMADAVIDGKAVYQFPTCAYVEEKSEPAPVVEVPDDPE